MKIEIEGQIIEASAVAVTIVEDTVPETMQAARRLIEHAHGRKAIVFRRHGEVEQREDGRFECEVELRDNHPSNTTGEAALPAKENA